VTILHKGIRRKTTDVLDDYGQAHYLQNVRLKRVGEMGRRAGLGKSNMAQLAGPVQFMIGAWSNESFIVSGTGGSVTGTEDPLAYWTAATMRIPGGQAGQPAAPVINSVTFNPASAVSGSDQFIDMTINYTYDGLSGPISVTTASNMGDGFVNFITVSSVVGTVVTYFLAAANPPGVYTTGMAPDGIQLTAGAFTSNLFTPSFTVT
jgi:hypothetical protein